MALMKTSGTRRSGPINSNEIESIRLAWKETIAVDFLPEEMRASERYHPSTGQQHVLAGCRIASPAFFLHLDAKLSEPADKDVFAVFQLVLHQLQKKLQKLGRLIFRETKFLVNGICNFRFGQCHVRRLPEGEFAVIVPPNVRKPT
jgi:hypothetical protein